jgi:putative transcriptional regulator
LHRAAFQRLAVAILSLGFAASLHADHPPARGMFLIANPEMTGSWFAEAVILLVQHDETGSLGLIVNRPTDVSPAEALPGVDGIDAFSGTLFIGGPVEAYGVLMLVRSEVEPADAAHVFADVYASGSQALLRESVRSRQSAERVRLYSGYAGWAPGQLDSEIRRGSWTVVPASAQHVFSTEPEKVWRKLAPAARAIIVRIDGPSQTI